MDFQMARQMARRNWLVRAGVLSLGSLAGGVVCAAQRERDLLPTPPQTRGPFYPVKAEPEKDADLTRVDGGSVGALGTVVVLEGAVHSLDGAPIAGALVEIWQACASGKYDHPRDRNPAPADPNFQYWARVQTDAAGAYRFKTIKPGAYPNSPDWMRPPHIHFRVVAPGIPALVTQMYFEGEELNLRDRILLDLTPAERKRVTPVFLPVAQQQDQVAGRFDIVLSQRLGAEGSTPMLD